MKKKNLLYSLVTLALIALIVGVISYATEMRPIQKEAQRVSVQASTTPSTPIKTTTVKKKGCGCCADRLARIQEQLRKARERKRASQF